MKYKLHFLFCFAMFCPVCAARPIVKIDAPLQIPLYLSGNFGELRSNHFHSGIDFKTQGVTDKPVYSVDSGYVSRISVSPYGYGNALYVTHPSGMTSVYGHLNGFSKKIAAIVEKKQYENESFAVNLTFGKDEIPVKRGEIIASSGNTGSSGGPHLHFELRDTGTEVPLDPLVYFRGRIRDNRNPEIKSIALYRIADEDEGAFSKKTVPVKNGNLKKQTLAEPLQAWGKIGLGIKAFDYMNETNNIYGVYSIGLTVDGDTVFSAAFDRFSFDESRYENSFTDYEEWMKNRSFIMKSFVDPGNRLTIYSHLKNRGVITIDEERPYRCTYILKDAFGNTTELKFTINGKKQPLPESGKSKGSDTDRMYYNKENGINKEGVSLSIPKGALYRNIRFAYDRKEDPQYCSAIHRLHNYTEPLHKNSVLRVKIDRDTLANKQQYCFRYNGRSPKIVEGKYDNGYLEAQVRELGEYAVTTDTEKPVIIPISPEKWAKTGVIVFSIRDNKSGIRSYRGEIDGKFVVFALDGKSGRLTHKLDKGRTGNNRRHNLKLTLTDNCGNEQQYTRAFTW